MTNERLRQSIEQLTKDPAAEWLCSDCKEKSQIAEQERAAIVAWLLMLKELYISRGQDTYVALEDIAHNLERGEHHGAPPEGACGVKQIYGSA
jgi:hypothetical protein